MNAPAQTPTGTAVGLEQMLAAREQPAARHSAVLASFVKPLVSMTLVMPGPVKDGPLPRRVLEVALRELDALASARNWPGLSREVWWQETGPEAIYVTAEVRSQSEIAERRRATVEKRQYSSLLRRC